MFNRLSYFETVTKSQCQMKINYNSSIIKALSLSVLIPGNLAMCTRDHAGNSQPPNILFCIADDASFHHFGMAGCQWVETPVFDRMASEGVFFNNCYTSNAKSAPSRASILTGRYSWQLKEGGNHITNFPSEFKVFTEALSDNDYMVSYTGKGWAPGNPGMVDGQPRLLTGKHYNKNRTTAPTASMSTEDYVANFIEFLDKDGSGGKPWFFWFGSREPHRAYEYGSGITLGGKSTDMIDEVPPFWPDTEEVRTDMLDYAFEIEYFDTQIGKMLDELEKRGMLDNTIIVVTSDNGMPFPRAKANNYEYSHHMPLAVMWKDGIYKPGRKINDLVNFVDLAPTFLDAAAIERERSGMHSSPGKSLLNIFKSRKVGKVDPERSYTLLGRERDDIGRPDNQGYPIRAIISGDFLYINNLKSHLMPAGNPETGYLDIDGSPTKTIILDMMRDGVDSSYYTLSMGLRPAEELYNLREDSFCVENLAGEEQYAATQKELRELLYSQLREQEDPRVVGGGDIFDRYPYSDPLFWNFYEKVMDGSIKEPWILTPWVSPTDYMTYKKEKDK